MEWLNLNYLKELLKNIWPWTTFEQQKRLAILEKKAENGSNEIKKQLYDEINKIKNECAQIPYQQKLSKTLELNQYQHQSASSTNVTLPTSSSHSYMPTQNRFPSPQQHCNSHHHSSKPPKPQKPISLTKEQQAFRNVYSTQSKIRAELRTSPRQNFQLQPLPSFPSPIQHHPKEDNVESEEESNHDSDKFAREQEALRLQSEKELERQRKELEMELQRDEDRIRKNFGANPQPNIQLASANRNPPSEVAPMPMPALNITNFANDLTAIMKKHRRPPSPILESYPQSIKSKNRGSRSADSPTANKTKSFSTKNHSSEHTMEVDNSYKTEIRHVQVIPKNDKIKIGVMGLNGAGKSYLISSLINIPFQELGNTKSMEYGENCNFYEIDHPNYGFVANQPEAIKLKCQEYFDQIQISNLTCLLNVISGDLREEDIFATQLALQAGIPVVIIRSKSDEWLDGSFPNNITEVNKQTFSEKDKQYVQTIAANIDEAVAKCPIFNISALSIYNISTKTKRASHMNKYLIDELALIQYMEKFGIHFDSLKNDIEEALDGMQDNRPKKVYDKYSSDQKVDILFVGRTGAGKSAIIDALRGIKENDKNSATKTNSCVIQNSKIAEFSYQEPASFQHIIDQLKQFNLHKLKQIYLVIGDTVGEIDAKIVKFAVDENLPLTILLTKTDLHIDNITERRGFERKDLEKYYNQRKKATEIEFSKLVQNSAAHFNLFVISSLVLRNLVTNTDKFLQYACDDSNFLTAFSKTV